MDIVSPTITNLIIFVLAIYVGYHVVWTVTPALHTPLMAVTNAVSAIVIVGAMLAAALTQTTLGQTMGVLAVALAAVNVFGGFWSPIECLRCSRKKIKSLSHLKENKHEHEFGNPFVFDCEHLLYSSSEGLESSNDIYSR